LQRQVQTELRAHIEHAALEEMSRADGVRGGDTIYSIDVRGEEVIVAFCEEWGRDEPFLLVAEGIEDTSGALPPGQRLFGCDDAQDARFILICDPIDGTRPLMYDKRSAWMLCGVAPNRGAATSMRDIEIAIQTELCTRKAARGDMLWAIRGEGAQAEETNFYTGEKRSWTPRASQAPSVEGGFAMLSKFFVGSKGWLAEFEEELMLQVLGAPIGGHPQTFDDQYISNGGQLFEMMTGRDRFNGDLRPLAHTILFGSPTSRLCSHPYDLCTELIARESGVIITDEKGGPLSAPLDVSTPMQWLAYANAQVQTQIEPTLLQMVARRIEEAGI
jgi:fructose-1,6-bisphosphatase/inositol monophosphatase family enzyme